MQYIPNDILSVIFEFCDLSSYLKLSLVKNNWNLKIKHLIQKQNFIQKYIEYIENKIKLPLHTNKSIKTKVYTKYLSKDKYIDYLINNNVILEIDDDDNFDFYINENYRWGIKLIECHKTTLPDSFLKKYPKFLWLAVRYCKISYELCNTHINMLSSYTYFYINNKLTEDFIHKYINILNLELVSLTQIMTIDFVKKHDILWNYALQYGIETNNGFIAVNTDKLNWYEIIQYRTLSEEFIECHLDKLLSTEHFWTRLVEYQILSESFIKKYSQYLSWDIVCSAQNMTEEFIMNYLDNISNYGAINIMLWNQPKTKSEISVMDKIRNIMIRNNGHFSENFLNMCIDKYEFMPLYWYSIITHYNLSIDFLQKHKDVICWNIYSLCGIITDDVMNNFKHLLNFDIIKNTRR